MEIMILVDIHVPMLDRVYDFELDEEAEVERLIEDILVLIMEQEQLSCKNNKDMCLYALGCETMLEPEKSLKQQGVCAGEQLILI